VCQVLALNSSAKAIPRSYMSAAARRDHLLAVAARLVRQGGWGALSMQGLAAAAGVSRQLVYERFANAEDLSVATLTHLFERAYEATAAIVRRGTDPTAVLTAAYELFLDLPAEERRALRALASDTDGGRRGLGRAKRRLRSRIAELWTPYVRQLTGVGEAEATALTWMLITAGWGLADSIAEGTVRRARGRELFVRFAVQTLTTWRTAPPSD
jgi:AcrR family transcriptional regulator